MHNPFMDPPVTEVNPFVPADEQSASVPGCGDPNCKRKHRLDGFSHYDSDASIKGKQLHEDGKFGGSEIGMLGGPKPKKNKRAAEIISDFAAEQAEAIKQVFADGIDDSMPIGVRLQAAKEILKVESDETQLAMQQQKNDFDAMNKKQLVGSIMETLGRLGKAGALTRGDDVIEGTAVEVDDD